MSMSLWTWLFGKKRENAKEYIRAVLFPPIVRRITDGTEFFVDRSVDANIEAVLQDLQEGHNDEMTMNTLYFVLGQLQKVRSHYNIHYDIKSDQTTSLYMVSGNE